MSTNYSQKVQKITCKERERDRDQKNDRAKVGGEP